MHLEGPRFSTPFSGLDYEIRSESEQMPVAMRRGFPVQVSYVTNVRTLQRVISIPRRSSYILSVSGLDKEKDYSRCSIIFTRPYTLRIVLHILAIIIAGGCLIAGVVFSILGLTGQ
ncbi:MAG: hypothetical protein MOB07_09125 [Acidobacteria bacterium]|nr:hypothetical protein [Acidobacteriota bacterium]